MIALFKQKRDEPEPEAQEPGGIEAPEAWVTPKTIEDMFGEFFESKAPTGLLDERQAHEVLGPKIYHAWLAWRHKHVLTRVGKKPLSDWEQKIRAGRVPLGTAIEEREGFEEQLAKLKSDAAAASEDDAPDPGKVHIDAEIAQLTAWLAKGALISKRTAELMEAMKQPALELVPLARVYPGIAAPFARVGHAAALVAGGEHSRAAQVAMEIAAAGIEELQRLQRGELEAPTKGDTTTGRRHSLHIQFQT